MSIRKRNSIAAAYRCHHCVMGREPGAIDTEPLGLDLADDAQSRYEEVRAMRANTVMLAAPTTLNFDAKSKRVRGIVPTYSQQRAINRARGAAGRNITRLMEAASTLRLPLFLVRKVAATQRSAAGPGCANVTGIYGGWYSAEGEVCPECYRRFHQMVGPVDGESVCLACFTAEEMAHERQKRPVSLRD